MSKRHLAGVVLMLLVAGGLWRFLYSPVPAKGEYDSFARCLAGKGFTMYGADWCSHCQNEKRAFGDSFRLVPYVECPKEFQVCIAQGVKGYPMWITKDGRRFEGELGLSKLVEKSECLLRQRSSEASVLPVQ